MGSRTSHSRPLPRSSPRERPRRERQIFRGGACSHRGSPGGRGQDRRPADGTHLHLPRDDLGSAGVHAEAGRLCQEPWSSCDHRRGSGRPRQVLKTDHKCTTSRRILVSELERCGRTSTWGWCQISWCAASRSPPGFLLQSWRPGRRLRSPSTRFPVI